MGEKTDDQLLTHSVKRLRPMSVKRYREGFTLVELVVVIVVLTVMASVAIPAYQDVQAAAQERSVRAGLVSVRSAITLYREKEIAAGRPGGPMNVGVSAVNRGWPRLTQLQNIEQCSSTFPFFWCFPKVMEKGKVPENTYRVTAPQTNDDHIQQSSGTNTATCSPEGTGVGALPSGTLVGWNYNPCTGEFWANSNQIGENAW